MTSRALLDAERRQLLEHLATLKSDDDDAVAQDAKWFLPLDSHSRALRPETLVVRGGRGAGKSTLFHFLGHLQRQPELGNEIGLLSDLRSTNWIEGFSASSSHPSVAILGHFARASKNESRRAFWFGWLCRCLSTLNGVPVLPAPLNDVPLNDVNEIARLASDHLSALTDWLDRINLSGMPPIVVTYDGLDRIGSTSSIRRKMTSSLLALWLELADRYARVRPKIFVREDLLNASLSAFPDASKLAARSVSLDWRVEDLYRVLIKHMANTSDALRNWVEDSARGVPLQMRAGLGWMPPSSLPETGKASQKAFVDHLAGEFMGTGEKKGLTYRWIPNRLQDAHARSVPRSILALIRIASEHAIARGPSASRLRLLVSTDLSGALAETSSRRVNELVEEFPVVRRMASLRSRTVMLARHEAVRALGQSSEDEYGNDGEQVLRVLIELGAMSERSDGRIDVPDIYRYGFGILRKGGVKRPV